MNLPKFCKDCKFMEEFKGIPYCECKSLPDKYDLVYGMKVKDVSESCIACRANESECGHDAKWFKQK